MQMKSKEIFPINDRTNKVQVLLHAVNALEAAENQILNMQMEIESLNAKNAELATELDASYEANSALEESIAAQDAPTPVMEQPEGEQVGNVAVQEMQIVKAAPIKDTTEPQSSKKVDVSKDK